MRSLDGFKKKTLRVKDIRLVNEKCARILSDIANLQVITDFDYTLTRYHSGDGVRIDSSWAALSVHEEFYKKSTELRIQYRPYEVDAKMSIAEKTPYIEEWYKKVNDLYIEHSFTRDTLNEIMANTKSNMTLRDKVPEFINRLYESKIPILVISAGLGETVERYLVKNNLYQSKYMKILSNFLKFDPETKKSVGFVEPLMHVFNKNGGSLIANSSPENVKEIQRRKHILLLGDSLGDLSMSDGIHSDDKAEVLSVGFLNHDFDDLLESYMDKYDIVLVDDQTMDFPNFLLDVLFDKEDAD